MQTESRHIQSDSMIVCCPVPTSGCFHFHCAQLRPLLKSTGKDICYISYISPKQGLVGGWIPIFLGYFKDDLLRHPSLSIISKTRVDVIDGRWVLVWCHPLLEISRWISISDIVFESMMILWITLSCFERSGLRDLCNAGSEWLSSHLDEANQFRINSVLVGGLNPSEEY